MNGIKAVFKDIVYISDEKNHASLIEGIKIQEPKNSYTNIMTWKILKENFKVFQ